MSVLGQFPNTRLRRLRQNESIRALIKETILSIDDLVLPLFIHHGKNLKKPILSMPGHFQYSVDCLEDIIKFTKERGIKNLILFGIPESKDPLGVCAYSDEGVIQQALPVIKAIAPEMMVIADLCFCEYTDHGHCGYLKNIRGRLEVDNDETLALLVKQAISLANANVDVIAPSGMMDGMVDALRRGLDLAGYSHLPILSYSAKYASSFYGPFREAAQGSPSFGDRRTHQMDFANQQEAIRECALDIAEGADMIMVKPAHTYLDVITQIKRHYPGLPLGAYHTSGEFAMIKAAAQKGWLDEQQAVIEVLTSIKRAGADFIITYYASEVADWM